MEKNFEIDNIDLRILAELVNNAKTPFTEVADKVFVSGGTVHVRMKKLEKLGIVKGSSLVLDYDKLGYNVTAFLGIYLEKNSYYDTVAHELEQISEIMTLHYTTGTYNLFAKIICKDTKHMRDVLHNKIQKISGIERVEAFISLEEKFDRAPSMKYLENPES
jgi:Lrp/AsnC family transcriptional regulator for asnA, asnC and gidA